MHKKLVKKKFLGQNVKNTVPWTYISRVKKKLQKTTQTEFRIQKVLRTKREKLYVKWNGYDNSFNSRINKGNIV